MTGNRICRQIDWYENAEQVEAWRSGRTGYPWIDACMRQMVNILIPLLDTDELTMCQFNLRTNVTIECYILYQIKLIHTHIPYGNAMLR